MSDTVAKPTEALASAAEAGPARAVSGRVLFGVVAIALFMSSVDTTIVATALPAMHRSLHASINWVGWSITIYSLGMIVALPIAGRVSDQLGRRKVFFGGVALFTAASLACGLANSIYLLIVFRAIQAFGGGALQPSAAGIVAEHFGKDRDRALGFFGSVASGGQVVGPVFGGLLVGYLSWRWVFFVNVPLGILLLWGIVQFVPTSEQGKRSRTDVRGLMLMTGFILALSFGITIIGNAKTTFADPVFLVPTIAGIAFLCAFARHTVTDADPFIPMRLLRARGFAIMNVINALWGGLGFGIAATLAPLYAEQRYHLVALDAGTLLTARGFAAMTMGALATMALRRSGYRLPLITGFSIVALGTALMAIAPPSGISPYTWLAFGAGISGAGVGVMGPASRNAVLQVAPDDVAAITGLRQMFSYVGIIFSVSIATAILNRSGNPAVTQAHLLWVVVGALLFVMVPLSFRVPEHKGSW
ncbi:MAG: MFS transporter [Acidimicrobiaceae bacterium]|nr:MFS transporter [Acidimicrobiaceae bacterium]